VKANGIKPGDMVQLSGGGGEISLQKSRKVTLPEATSSDFFNVLEETTKKHDEALKELADR
jgi:hypothetical protein